MRNWLVGLEIQSPPTVPFPETPQCAASLLPRFPDGRGQLIDIANEYTEQGILKAYYMETFGGEARDMSTWHIHHQQTDRFVVLKGYVLFALSDGLDVMRIRLSETTPVLLTIPPGIYHCFRVMGSRTAGILGLPDRLYDKRDEGRVLFSELSVNFPWPLESA